MRESVNRALWGSAVILYFALLPLLSSVTDDEVFLWVRGLSTVEFVIGLCATAAVICSSVSSLVYVISRIAPRLPTTGILVVIASVSSFQPLGPLGGWQLSPFQQLFVSVISAFVLEFLTQRVRLIAPLLFFGVAGFVLSATWNAPAPFHIERNSPSILEKNSSEPFSVLFLVIDSVGADQIYDETGKVFDHLANLKSFSNSATIYTRAVTQYGQTSYAIPAILNGFDARQHTPSIGEQVIAEHDRFGIFPASDEFGDRYYYSPSGPTPCGIADDRLSYTCDGFGRTITSFVKKQEVLIFDLLGHFAWNSFFPIRGELDELTFRQKDYFGRRTNFTQTLSELGDFVKSVDRDKEFFAFYHYLGTHEPWTLDRTGRPLWSVNEEVVNDKGFMNTEKLLELQQRIRHESVLRFDNEFGQLINQLKSANKFEKTMIIVTSDHGSLFGGRFANTDRSDNSIDNTLRHVANIPLLVKFSGQKSQTVIDELRSNTQVANDIRSRAGSLDNMVGRPTLDEPLPSSARFFSVQGGTINKSIPVMRLSLIQPASFDFAGDVSSWIESMNKSARSQSIIGLGTIGIRLDDVVWFGNDESKFQLVRFDVINIGEIAACDELVVLEEKIVIGRIFGEQFNETASLRHYFGLLPGKKRDVQVQCLGDTR